MIKNFLLIFSLLMLSCYVNAETKSALKQVLYVGDNHLAKAKIKLLKESAKLKGLSIEIYSTRNFNKGVGLEKLCDYPVVVMQAVSQDAAVQMFAAFPAAIKQCEVKSVSVGFELNGLNKGFTVLQKERISEYASNGLRKNYENLFAYIANQVFQKDLKVEEAIILPKVGLYHPDFDGLVSNVRGRGLFAAFDLPNGSARDTLADLIIAEGALILGSGNKSIRFRPHLNITREEIDLADEIIRRAIARL